MPNEPAGPRFWFGRVVETQVGRRWCRVRLTGPDLAGFPDGPPDQSVYLMVPRPGEAGPPVDDGFDWSHWRRLPASVRPLGAHYTVASVDRSSASLTVEILRHGGGPLSCWAERAPVGDEVAMWGPSGVFAAPTDATVLDLFSDESGLPVVRRVLATVPRTVTVRATVEVDRVDGQLVLPRAHPVTWLEREWAGASSAPLFDAVRGWSPPSEPSFLWVAGEHREMVRIRRWLHHRYRLSRQQAQVLSYWRAERAR